MALSAREELFDEEPSSSHELEEWQLAVVDLFVHAVHAIGLPRSVGQIYGLLFASETPLAMREITEQLQISKASASQGLRMLRQFNAVKTVFVIGARSDRYEAELSLRRLIHGFLSEIAEPHLDSGQSRLANLYDLARRKETTLTELAISRTKMLESWHNKVHKLLPVVRNFL